MDIPVEEILCDLVNLERLVIEQDISCPKIPKYTELLKKKVTIKDGIKRLIKKYEGFHEV